MTTAPKPLPKLSKFEQRLLSGIRDRVKPRVTAAFEDLKAKLLKALEGQPLIVIGSVVAAIDVLLLKGPQPLPANVLNVLVSIRELIDKFVAPPKPLSPGVRKLLAGIVTLAGMLGIQKLSKGGPSHG